MWFERFPDRADERRIIVPLAEDEYGRCSYDEVGRELLRRSDTWVVPVPVPDQLRVVEPVARILDEGELVPGQTLLQSPYRFDNYDPADLYVERTALRKHLLFADLCRHLGARAVSVTSVTATGQDAATALEVKLNKGLAKGQVHARREKWASLVAQFELDDEFDKQSCDVESARALLVANHLTGEPVLASLLQARASGGTTLRKRTYTVEVTRETVARLQILGRVRMPLFASGTADFQRLVRESESYRVAYAVSF